MNCAFNKRHPLFCFLFFIAVILFSMFLMNPICLVLSFLCALINAIQMNDRKSVLGSLKFVLPTALLIMLINPVINHAGVTILGYLPWNNPLTLESVVYGIASALMLSSVVFWFSSVHTVLTSDKWIYLFSRITPSLGLVFSMALRFVPRFHMEFKEARNAQKMLIRDSYGLVNQLRIALSVFSVMLSHSMEGAIETADSMKARGYGLKGRTAYANYRFSGLDGICAGIFFVLVSLLTILCISGTANFRYFPAVKGGLFDIKTIIFYILYAALMFIPFVINTVEVIRWKRLQSVI